MEDADASFADGVDARAPRPLDDQAVVGSRNELAQQNVGPSAADRRGNTRIETNR